MRARAVLATVVTSATVVAAVTVASAGAGPPDLQDVRTATARYHSVKQAEKAGYEPFLDCFGSPEGGMGQHLVNFDEVDAVVERTKPEALVYEVGGDKLTLVGVEYIVPMALAPTAPTLFGETFHPNDALGVWVLHAWLWRDNPTGLFMDWNPNVAPCPD